MTKEQLRKIYLQKRKDLNPQEKLRLDDLLLLQMQTIDFTGIETVLTYWGMQQNNEPNTHLFNGYLRHFIPELQLCYPVSNFETNTMQAIAIDEDTVYITNKYGITEPKFGKEVDPQKIDLILVPLLAFDIEGFRVGYGKGFYDKFIAQCKPNVITLGYSYFEPVELIENIEDYDMPLCCCITPHEIYDF